MHRVTLSSWHGGQPPGSELDVDDDELAALRRDGRVASVLPYETGALFEPAESVTETEAALPVDVPADTDDQADEAESAAEDDGQAKAGRRRR